VALRILVVDDEPEARDALAEWLATFGHEVRTAADGDRALVEASRFLPEVMLLDLELPGMGGYEVARRVRADPRLHRARLIAVTGQSRPSDRRHEERLGIERHLTKPVRPAQLAQLIDDSGPSLVVR
jgi:CheY-like chemotaxis protein